MRGFGAGAAIAVVLAGACGVARATEPNAAGKAAGAATAASAPKGTSGDPSTAGLYVPPAPDGRLAGGRVGGGTRSTRPNPCGAKLSVIAPEDHAGLTLEAQPTLYYFLSGDTDCEVSFVLNDRRQVPPLVEAAVPAPHAAGLHAIRFTDSGVSLEPEIEYDWFVQLKGRAGEPGPAAFSGAQVRRVAPSAALVAELAKPGARKAQVLGRHSIWYDSVAALSQAIDAAPGDGSLRAQRAELFDAQDLDDAAAADRSAAAK